jgi:uncharacterized protein
MEAAGMANVIRRLRILQTDWQEILPRDTVRTIAQTLLGQHAVRAADALQLAAALVWCHERPQHLPFVCFDNKLAETARLIGFSVIS